VYSLVAVLVIAVEADDVVCDGLENGVDELAFVISFDAISEIERGSLMSYYAAE
jgi:hypothetical protein